MTSYEFLREYIDKLHSQPTDVMLDQALWRLELMTPERVQSLATKMMAEGYDSPSLVKLAANLVESYDTEKNYDRALLELGYELIDWDQAVQMLANDVAKRIADGSVSSDVGVDLLLYLRVMWDYPVWPTEAGTAIDELNKASASALAKRLA